MDTYIEIYSIQKQNQEESKNLNRQIITSVIEAVIKKKIPVNKSPGPDGFPGEFYQTFKEELTPILLKLFQRIRGEKTPKLILRGQQYHNSKIKDTTKKEIVQNP